VSAPLHDRAEVSERTGIDDIGRFEAGAARSSVGGDATPAGSRTSRSTSLMKIRVSAATASVRSLRNHRLTCPPLNVATFGERISGSANQGRARDATREQVHCGEDHREAPRG